MWGPVQNLFNPVHDIVFGVLLADAVCAADCTALGAKGSARIIHAYNGAAILGLVVRPAGGHRRSALRTAEKSRKQILAVKSFGRGVRFSLPEELHLVPQFLFDNGRMLTFSDNRIRIFAFTSTLGPIGKPIKAHLADKEGIFQNVFNGTDGERVPVSRHNGVMIKLVSNGFQSASGGEPLEDQLRSEQEERAAKNTDSTNRRGPVFDTRSACRCIR